MKKCKGRWIIVFLSLSFWFFGSFLSETTLAAEKDFPKKEITVIIGYAAGGGRDTLARGVVKTMTKYLGVPMVIMNLPGAGGARGLIQLYNSAPDGYTIGVGAATEIIDQIVQKQDYDCKKISYIGNVQHTPLFIFVKPDSPVHSLKDLKTLGKPARFSAFSVSSPSTVHAIVLAKRESFPLTVVAGYPSVSAAILALIRGEVDFTDAQASVSMQYVRSGQIRPIVTFDHARYPDLPNIPTAGELGHKDLDVSALDTWFMAPPGVPKARLQIIEDALMKTLKDPEFLAWAKGANIDPGPLNSEETAKLVLSTFKLFEPYKAEIEKYISK